MSEISRRGFSAALGLAPAGAAAQGQAVLELPVWQRGGGEGERFSFPGPPSPRTHWRVASPGRKYFPERLPALFERTIEVDSWTGGEGALVWIFTGPCGGFTVEAGGGRVRLTSRYYDSTGLDDGPGRQAEQARPAGAAAKPGEPRPPTVTARHPERIREEGQVAYRGDLRSITVAADHRQTFRVRLNGKEALVAKSPLDLHRHQLAYSGAEAKVEGRLLPASGESARVEVEEREEYQEMLGFGGIAALPAFAELGAEGAAEWWRLLAEYNLLLQREYPNGAMLNEAMSNWDTLADASPHYYGDNFPNSEVTNFEYLRGIRRLGGKVIFEFWELPLWARRRDAGGKALSSPVVGQYVRAMVRYCEVSKERTGAAPEIVGIQNEVAQSVEDWRAMTVALRRGLDSAGFRTTRIHSHNASNAKAGIEALKGVRMDAAAWAATDYATSNLYDFQQCFHDPDAFDARLAELRAASGEKPFLAVELCVNHREYQARSYRLALSMAQLYHKALTQLNAEVLMYCWTLLNVEQPSYGWTRTLFAPDAERGLRPAATSHQLRTFGAYSRRVRAGMKRVKAVSSSDGLLAVAFAGSAQGRRQRTVVLLNRSCFEQKVELEWKGAEFLWCETASLRQENAVSRTAGPVAEVTVAPGSIVTLSNVALGKAAAGQA
ncbi:MAG: hypothetical protein HY821_14215 [Acidobacteria bacterium]|nr:hypothetical protein [Acidobacteriota bacterium]